MSAISLVRTTAATGVAALLLTSAASSAHAGGLTLPTLGVRAGRLRICLPRGIDGQM